MRIDTQFGKRLHPSQSMAPKKTYYLVSEGSITEPQYFFGIQQYREEIGIHPSINIKPLLRNHGDEGLSNPIHLLSLIEKELHSPSLVNKIMDFLVESHYLVNGVLFEKIKSELESLLNELESPTAEELAEVLSHIQISCDIQTLEEYLDSQNLIFDPEYDKICIIADRD